MYLNESPSGDSRINNPLKEGIYKNGIEEMILPSNLQLYIESSHYLQVMLTIDGSRIIPPVQLYIIACVNVSNAGVIIIIG